MTFDPWPEGTSMVLQLDKLENVLVPGYLNSATVTATAKDAVTGAAVSGATWPVVLSYITGSDGRYRTTIPYDVVITQGQRLLVDYLAVSGTLRLEKRQYFLVT